MDVIALIDGREAIPIRAIPSVTGWLMCPINLAMSLANADLEKKLKGVTAYHLLSNSGPAKTLPKEWDVIVIDLQVLYSKLGGDEKIKQENIATWRRDSIPLLPAGAFVWKDEFEHAFTRFYGSESHFRLEEREGDRELNYSPMISPELRMTITEGFATPWKTGAAKNRRSTDRGYLSDKLIKMNQAAEKLWANADRNDRDTHPDNAKVAVWFEQHGFSPTLANKAATLIRPEWVPTGRKPEE